MIIAPKKFGDRIRLIAIEMKGAFGNEGALPAFDFYRKEALAEKLIEIIMRSDPEPGYCFAMSFADGSILVRDPHRPKILVSS